MSLLLRSGAVLLALLILISSVGLTVNAHYCFTTNTLKKGLLVNSLKCAHENSSCTVDISTVEGAQTCCKTEEKKTPEKDCCKDFSYYLKIVTDFDLPSVKVVFNQFMLLALKVINLVLPQAEEQKSASIFPFSDPPPPVSGLKFLVSISQLKIDHHLL